MIKKVVKWKMISMTTVIICLVMLSIKNKFFGHEIDTVHIVLASVAGVSLIGATILQTIIDAQNIEDIKT